MPRGYLNSLSFPATDVESSLELLSELRQGIAKLIDAKVIETPIMCTIRAAQLPISPGYDTLLSIAKSHRGRFRDTILFYMTMFDQRSPVHIALSPEDQKEARPSIVDEGACFFDPEAATVLVSCALDGGVLLSLGSSNRWREPSIEIKMLTATAQAARSVALSNVHNAITADVVKDDCSATRSKYLFENWNYLTGEARRSPQIDEWFAECRMRLGLETIIMRSLALAHEQGWVADGELIKKLEGNEKTPIFEVRAWYRGSNNVRVLFGRLADGSIAIGYGGIKTKSNWYDHAILQAIRFICST